MAGKHRLHLAWLNPKTANLDLVVETAKKFDVAAGKIAGEIAGSIKAYFRIIRVGNEFFGGKFISVEIAPRQAVSTDIHLSRHAYGHEALVGIKQVNARIGDRMADGRQEGPAAGRACKRVSGDHVGFRWTILIMQLASREIPKQIADLGGNLQLLPGSDDLPQGCRERLDVGGSFRQLL